MIYLQFIIVILFIAYIFLCEFKCTRTEDYGNEIRMIHLSGVYTYNFSIKFINSPLFVRIVFFIESAVDNLCIRNKIKDKWIRRCLKLSCNYYFAIATEGHIKEIEYESDNSNILGVDIIDNYYNLTILTSNIFKYYILNNLKSDYLIKNDDDIYPNIPLIFIYINLYINKSKISGFYYPKMRVSRNVSSSVYLPYYLYPFNTFPAFVAGGFVIIHSNYISSFYMELNIKKEILYREDMHMALIYKKYNIQYQKLNKYYHRKSKHILHKQKLYHICWHGFK